MIVNVMNKLFVFEGCLFHKKESKRLYLLDLKDLFLLYAMQTYKFISFICQNTLCITPFDCFNAFPCR
ncbi:hypothetical protein RIF29_18411 [Crotalaria pallida]|uniref:Uncharacterized protein n=1 Tax=Crotalaria pallida TaxID=3830 RepID=A0AAN9FPV6_CROPI